MAKKIDKKNSDKNYIVELWTALGFFIGSVVCFCIYFPKSGLHFDKLLIYMGVGCLIGGLIGELDQYYQKKKNEKNKKH